MQPSVWIVGDGGQSEFVAAVGWLQQSARCISFDCAAAACGSMSDEPAAILFLETRPGQFRVADVERLHEAFPLARLVALIGPWCEGPQRTSGPLHGVTRVRWSDWENRLAREMGLARDGDSAPPLPRTMTGAERIERDVASVKSADCAGGRIAVCASSRVSFQVIAEAAERLGFLAVRRTERSRAPMLAYDVVIYDGWEQVCAEGDLAGEEGGRDLPKRMLLLSFPRADDLVRAAKLGMDAVIAQPMLLRDFEIGLGG